jgi:hypothetical protein
VSDLHNPDLDPSTLPAFRCAKCNTIAQSIMVGAERQWIGWCPDHGWTAVQRTEAADVPA